MARAGKAARRTGGLRQGRRLVLGISAAAAAALVAFAAFAAAGGLSGHRGQRGRGGGRAALHRVRGPINEALAVAKQIQAAHSR